MNNEIKLKFAALCSLEDLVDLLNLACDEIVADPKLAIRLEDLMWCMKNIDEEFAYYSFEISKKTGGTRVISAPCRRLKSVQRAINALLRKLNTPSDFSFGFEANRSVADNARVHVGSNYVYNLDLKDFFGSVDVGMVINAFEALYSTNQSIKQEKSIELNLSKFNEKFCDVLSINGVDVNENPNQVIEKLAELDSIKGIDYEYVFLGRYDDGPSYHVLLGNERSTFKSHKTAIFHTIQNDLFFERRRRMIRLIAKLCTRKLSRQGLDVRVLPQGAPTSPALSNMVATKLDKSLGRLAKRFNLKYSRYADDITFSSAYNAFKVDSDFLKLLEHTITESGFSINEVKTRLQSRHHRQEVTGLNVNTRIGIRKKKIKEFRMWLYFIERYGYERANAIFGKRSATELILFLRGYLAYMSMIYGNDSYKVSALKFRLNKILGMLAMDDCTKMEDSSDFILDTLLSHGIDEGMDILYLNGK